MSKTLLMLAATTGDEGHARSGGRNGENPHSEHEAIASLGQPVGRARGVARAVTALHDRGTCRLGGRLAVSALSGGPGPRGNAALLGCGIVAFLVAGGTAHSDIAEIAIDLREVGPPIAITALNIVALGLGGSGRGRGA